MRVPLAEWRRPIDDGYAFSLRAPATATPTGRVDIRDVARAVLEEGHAERFERAVSRWPGPEDGPYASAQLAFEEQPWRMVLTRADLEPVLRGTVAVLRRPDGPTDYFLRDHHMLDVVLYHYWTTGALPTALFHADRHSDWCTDGFLVARVPPQAATWWALLAGLKRPDGAPALAETAVCFATAQADGLPGRDVGASTRVPWWVEREDLVWDRALARSGDADWVSVDLDYLQPAPQLALTRGMLRDPRFQRLMAAARVRAFVLSPQFTNGGDQVPWRINGSVASSLRLINLLRSGER